MPTICIKNPSNDVQLSLALAKFADLAKIQHAGDVDVINEATGGKGNSVYEVSIAIAESVAAGMVYDLLKYAFSTLKSALIDETVVEINDKSTTVGQIKNSSSDDLS
ncbi:hypothetical protein ParKJ_10250 [Paraburkholderia fungorum]|uniref:Uncharacterized protein n=1 Tax=Paraburkholderia fungorum TaxID=134537 RepID=A0AAP5UT84_9BURK|nr:hypothetical protein [Paraburkholderia fungorum]MDT8837793.1 hypothetical protein [Paraburkholderia fungorum]